MATPGRDEAVSLRDELIGQIDDYLLPRLRSLDAPLLAVVGGSTGAGKSTLVNSIVRTEASPAGVLRPTTRSPVLVCHPSDGHYFRDDRILPGFARTTGAPPVAVKSLHLILDSDVPAGLALLDAPDIDSVEAANRVLASELLSAADLWLFVTTAARYADAVPWELLRKAQMRSTALAVVLNRVPGEALEEVTEHLRTMLGKGGLERAPIFVIPESRLDEGLIDESVLAPVREWLLALAADSEARSLVMRMTLEGALDSLTERVRVVADQLDAQTGAADALGRGVKEAYGSALGDIEDGLSGGTLLRGEVLARWQEVVGTGELMRNLEQRIGWLRDRVRESVLGQPSPTSEVRTALGNSVETLVVAAADRAAERTVESWGAQSGGRGVLAGKDSVIGRSSKELPRLMADEVRAWQQRVFELVAQEGASKRATGRILSMGVNGLGVALMVAVFAQTGGLSGGELVIAGGTATVSQKILEALFGDQAVRSLTSQARADLLRRIRVLFEHEAQRFEKLLEGVTPQPGQADQLGAVARDVQAARIQGSA